jgi:hypothetical protein
MSARSELDALNDVTDLEYELFTGRQSYDEDDDPDELAEGKATSSRRNRTRISKRR